MNKFITKVIKENRFEQLAPVTLEEEMALNLSAENYRHELHTNLSDIERTIDLTEALEGLAIVATEITTATPAQAALLQIAGDIVVAGSDMDGEEITPSLEGIQESATAVTGKVRAAIEAIIRAIKDLLARIGDVARRYIQSLRTAVGGHVQRVAVIRERLAKTKFPINGGTDFSMSMPVIGSNVLKTLPDVFKEASHLNAAIDAFVKYAGEFNIQYASGMTDLYAKLSTGKLDVVEQFSLLEKIADTTSRVSGRLTTSTNVAPNFDYYDVKTFSSADLLGGVSIVQTTALMKADPKTMSSASVRDAIGEFASHIKLKVVVEHLGFGRDEVEVKPMTELEITNGLKVVDALLEHFTGKSEHSSLAAASTRRLELAETAVEHITKYIERFDKNDLAAQEYSNAALRVTNSIINNATSPYSMLTTAINRCLTLLLNAILKSLNAHELAHRQVQYNQHHAATMQQKTV